MKEEKFKLIQFIREFLYKIESELDNFPKKDIEIKNKIKMSTYDLLEVAYLANTTLDMELRKRLIEQLIAKIKVIDFLLNLAKDKKSAEKFINALEKAENKKSKNVKIDKMVEDITNSDQIKEIFKR